MVIFIACLLTSFLAFIGTARGSNIQFWELVSYRYSTTQWWKYYTRIWWILEDSERWAKKAWAHRSRPRFLNKLFNLPKGMSLFTFFIAWRLLTLSGIESWTPRRSRGRSGYYRCPFSRKFSWSNSGSNHSCTTCCNSTFTAGTYRCSAEEG